MQAQAGLADVLQAVEPGVACIKHVMKSHLKQEAEQTGLPNLEAQLAEARAAVSAAQSQLAQDEATAVTLQHSRWSDSSRQEAASHVQFAQGNLRYEQQKQLAISAQCSSVRKNLETLKQKMVACMLERIQNCLELADF